MRRLDLPPVYFVLTIAAMLLLHAVVPLVQLIGWPGRLFGLVPMSVGVILAFKAERRFERAGTGVIPFTDATAVVEDGPFAYTRNPMYLGMMLFVLGLATALGSIITLLPPILLFYILHRRFVLREEAFMEERMGEPYRRYKGRVRRWL